MAYENVLLERDGAVAILTINRPQVRNALNRATLAEIAQVVDEIASDTSVRALIVTGSGDRAFVAGADINELRELSSGREAGAFAEYGQHVFYRLEQLDRPVIIAINGYALGGGLELAMAGDIRIAAENAQLGQPEINLGIFPGYGGTQRLPRLVGKGAAKLMIMSGEMISAQEALRLGLVDRVVPAGDLLPSAKALAQTLASKAPLAIASAKKAVNLGMERDLGRAIALEAQLFGEICQTEDRIEGTSAFLEKRKPEFKGR